MNLLLRSAPDQLTTHVHFCVLRCIRVRHGVLYETIVSGSSLVNSADVALFKKQVRTLAIMARIWGFWKLFNFFLFLSGQASCDESIWRRMLFFSFFFWALVETCAFIWCLKTRVPPFTHYGVMKETFAGGHIRGVQSVIMISGEWQYLTSSLVMFLWAVLPPYLFKFLTLAHSAPLTCFSLHRRVSL